MGERKKILIVDVPDVYNSFAPFIHRWGYKVSGVHSSFVDSILEMISSKRIDLLIVAIVQFFSNETKLKNFESHWFCDFSSIFSCFLKFGV